MRRSAFSVALLVMCASAMAGCGAFGSSAPSPQPAGREPSPIAKEVCGTKASTEIADVLGENAHITTPTWANHVYSCNYNYGKATMALSVKELSSWPETYAYFDGLGRALHERIPVLKLGQRAFEAADGSVVVRKDWKVLLVNVRGLPGMFGVPASTSANVALTVAGVILGCWHGD